MAACLARWGANLQDLKERHEEALQRPAGEPTRLERLFLSTNARGRYVLQHLAPGMRLLYVGAGTGRECFMYQNQGIRTVGIDVLRPLLAIGRRWADRINVFPQFAGMDVMALGFRPDTFDAFLLEFYGSTPSREATLTLQQQLARVLKPDGLGIVSAARKKYPSYWFLGKRMYPQMMRDWLISQADLDCRYQAQDAYQDRLLGGLFQRVFTVETLTAELSHSFDVVECAYATDPRYVLAIVTPRTSQGADRPPFPADPPFQPPAAAQCDAVAAELARIEPICDLLEQHTAQVIPYFADPTTASPGRCFRELAPNAAQLVALLQALETHAGATATA